MVTVNHVDLIAGEVTGPKTPNTYDYKWGEKNPTTKVVARFFPPFESVEDDGFNYNWSVDDGYNVVSYTVQNVQKNMYYRLRGTNLGLNVENETDADGNPLCDDLIRNLEENDGVNKEEDVWADLWFYSNPIFVEISK